MELKLSYHNGYIYIVNNEASPIWHLKSNSVTATQAFEDSEVRLQLLQLQLDLDRAPNDQDCVWLVPPGTDQVIKWGLPQIKCPFSGVLINRIT